MSLTRQLTIAGIGLAMAAGLGWALWPRPLAVDLAVAARGPMVETLAAEGMTRVREPYAVTAPIAGTLGRLPVEVGDAVIEGVTVLGVIRPADPALMDARSRAQAEAAVTEAEAALALAETNLRRAMSALSFSQSELERARALAAAGTIARRTLEDAEQGFTLASQSLAAARSERDLHQATLARARAQLLGPDDLAPANGAVTITAPHSGTVLQVVDPSERLVLPGASLMTLGDLDDLEIEVDLLSTDVVRVVAGAAAMVERWGGEGVLEARVRRIEPSAFTRVSALGIEEQRVRLKLDFVTPPDQRAGLGDRFRVFVRIVTWQDADVLRVPQAALFRDGGGWAVFRVLDGTARLTPVAVGRQAEGQAQILSGLDAGAVVVLYPAATLADGARVAPREG